MPARETRRGGVRPAARANARGATSFRVPSIPAVAIRDAIASAPEVAPVPCERDDVAPVALGGEPRGDARGLAGRQSRTEIVEPRFGRRRRRCVDQNAVHRVFLCCPIVTGSVFASSPSSRDDVSVRHVPAVSRDGTSDDETRAVRKRRNPHHAPSWRHRGTKWQIHPSGEGPAVNREHLAGHVVGRG
jgi:hypothetical protein